MQWELLLQSRRFKADPNKNEDGRSQFHKDYDRIVFSQALRRLARKTQVHPLTINDHVHTRLTHSLEVASVGRSLGQRVGESLCQQQLLPKDLQPEDIGVIVQSACLAHDIGNPPFGHTGENCIRDWFKHRLETALFDGIQEEAQRADLLWYDGNAQGFRIVTQLEKHWFTGGLRLTLPTLGTLLKYPWLAVNSPKPGKFSCFSSELPLLTKLTQELGMIQHNPGQWIRHPLAFLVEAADDICYLILDLEDAVELGIIRWPDFLELFKSLIPFEQMQQVVEQTIQPKKTRMAIVRGLAMDIIINVMVETFLKHQDQFLQGTETQPLSQLTDNICVKNFLHEARIFTEDIIFKNREKTGVEIGAFATLETLLDAFVHAGFALQKDGYNRISSRHKSLVELMGNCQPHENLSTYEIYLRCLDFISGMTDQYAARLANQIRGI